MKPIIDLTDGPFNTSFAPLCVLGSVLQERETLKTLRYSTFIRAKQGDHTPGEKLVDAFLGTGFTKWD